MTKKELNYKLVIEHNIYFLIGQIIGLSWSSTQAKKYCAIADKIRAMADDLTGLDRIPEKKKINK